MIHLQNQTIQSVPLLFRTLVVGVRRLCRLSQLERPPRRLQITMILRDLVVNLLRQ
jgi:hypothetical protein